MAGLGWLGITIPEEYGGAGGSFLDLYPDLRGDGPLPRAEPAPRHRRGRGRDRSSAPGATRSSEHCLPAIARRRLHRQPRGRSRATARSVPAAIACSAQLSGERLRAHAAPSCSWRTRRRPTSSSSSRYAAVTDGRRRHLALPRRRARRRRSRATPMPEHRRQRAVRGDASTTCRGAGRQPRRRRWTAAGRPLSAATTKAAVLQTATIVGAAQAVLDMTNQYAKDREQFGGPIGRYQAVQYLVSATSSSTCTAPTCSRSRRRSASTRASRTSARRRWRSRSASRRPRTSTVRRTRCTPASRSSSSTTSRSTRAASKFWENNLGDARYYQEQLAGALGM